MKTLKTIFAIVALVASVNIAFAKGGQTKVNLIPLSDEKAIVTVNSDTPESYRLILKSKNGEVVHQTRAKETQAFKQIFDFKNLEDGEYRLVVANNDFKAERDFEIKDNAVIVGKHKYIAAPVFSFQDNILRVSYLNYENKAVSFKIYEDNQELYSKTIDKDFIIHEGVNFAKLRHGNYSIVLSDDEENYNYTVNK